MIHQICTALNETPSGSLETGAVLCAFNFNDKGSPAAADWLIP